MQPPNMQNPQISPQQMNPQQMIPQQMIPQVANPQIQMQTPYTMSQTQQQQQQQQLQHQLNTEQIKNWKVQCHFDLNSNAKHNPKFLYIEKDDVHSYNNNYQIKKVDPTKTVPIERLFQFDREKVKFDFNFNPQSLQAIESRIQPRVPQNQMEQNVMKQQKQERIKKMHTLCSYIFKQIIAQQRLTDAQNKPDDQQIANILAPLESFMLNDLQYILKISAQNARHRCCYYNSNQMMEKISNSLAPKKMEDIGNYEHRIYNIFSNDYTSDQRFLNNFDGASFQSLDKEIKDRIIRNMISKSSSYDPDFQSFVKVRLQSMLDNNQSGVAQSKQPFQRKKITITVNDLLLTLDTKDENKSSIKSPHQIHMSIRTYAIMPKPQPSQQQQQQQQQQQSQQPTSS